MFKLFLSTILIFQSSYCLANNHKGEYQRSLMVTASLMNSTATNESFLNYFGIVAGQISQVEELKSKLDPKILNMAPPKLKFIDDHTLSAGRNTIAYSKGQFSFDGKVVTYNPSKSLLENYSKMILEIGQNKKKSTKLQFLFTPAFAEEKSVSTEAVAGGVLFTLGAGAIGTAVASMNVDIFASLGALGLTSAGIGATLFVHSEAVSAADGIIPVKVCEKNGDSYRNSFKHVSGQIITEDYKVEPDTGALVVTIKTDGVIDSQSTVQKQNGSYSVVKLVQDGKSLDLKSLPLNNQGQIFYKTFAGCSDPQMRKKISEDVKKLALDIKAGKIKLVEPSTSSVQVPRPNNGVQ